MVRSRLLRAVRRDQRTPKGSSGTSREALADLSASPGCRRYRRAGDDEATRAWARVMGAEASAATEDDADDAQEGK